MTEDLKYYAGFKDWYNENVDPIFTEISDILAQEIKQNGADALLNDYMMIFIKNSLALFELLSKYTCSYQIIMTIRLLIELSADISFISRFPENISIIKNRYDKIRPNFFNLTFAEVGAEAKRFRLWEFNNGRKCGNATTTEKRVELAYGSDGLSFYQYLNAYSHFNHLGVIYDLYLTHPSNAPTGMNNRLTLLLAYPNCFRAFIGALGNLCKSDKLREYDCSKMDQVITSLKLRAKIKDTIIANPN